MTTSHPELEQEVENFIEQLGSGPEFDGLRQEAGYLLSQIQTGRKAQKGKKERTIFKTIQQNLTNLFNPKDSKGEPLFGSTND